MIWNYLLAAAVLSAPDSPAPPEQAAQPLYRYKQVDGEVLDGALLA
jgi:hypothetical protein